VPDTNALLHYTRFDQLLWAERMQAGLVRPVIPLAVVEELDGKKYARRAEFQQRAREMLTLIDRYVTASPPDGYSQVRESVMVEVLPDEPGHLRMPSTDQEILERCEFLHQVTGNPATLITGDTGMRINARGRGINVFKLSDDDLLPRYKQQEADPVINTADADGQISGRFTGGAKTAQNHRVRGPVNVCGHRTSAASRAGRMMILATRSEVRTR
jgi:predicted ribonuclease YlaK